MASRFNWIPNALTFLRIFLVIPFAVCLYNQHYRLALIVFFIAAFSDGVDGFLARQFNWRTRLGAIADPLADKTLLITAYFVLTWTGVLPVWLFILVLGRDLFIVLGGLAFHYLIGQFDMAPSILGKLNTLVQVLVVLAIIILLAGGPMPPQVFDWGIWLVASVAVLSGLHYTVVWTRRAWLATR